MKSSPWSEWQAAQGSYCATYRTKDLRPLCNYQTPQRVCVRRCGIWPRMKTAWKTAFSDRGARAGAPLQSTPLARYGDDGNRIFALVSRFHFIRWGTQMRIRTTWIEE
ncbi:hypothetical protein [Paraburkholderia sp. PGU19]|uniref:hypothetical protein n=1 Tax=Paraburkholderia sp. PGU19 TaxID=2735434 RepID=UPI0015D967C2|nr:hypothetical protein [Paraburkholderia sp. PGU19]